MLSAWRARCLLVPISGLNVLRHDDPQRVCGRIVSYL